MPDTSIYLWRSRHFIQSFFHHQEIVQLYPILGLSAESCNLCFMLFIWALTPISMASVKIFSRKLWHFDIILNCLCLSSSFMQGKYKVHNLCSERSYNASLFEGRYTSMVHKANFATWIGIVCKPICSVLKRTPRIFDFQLLSALKSRVYFVTGK